MPDRRRIIVHIATSADGFIARPDGDLHWLTSRPKPAGFYGIGAFMKSVDTMLLGRRTYEESRRLGGTFDRKSGRYVVFSHQPRPADAPPQVEWTGEGVGPFVEGLREQPGRNVWLMGGGDLIASFLDAGAIDELVITMVPVLIGEGIPLIAPSRREVPLALLGVERFDDGVVQLQYRVADAIAR